MNIFNFIVYLFLSFDFSEMLTDKDIEFIKLLINKATTLLKYQNCSLFLSNTCWSMSKRIKISSIRPFLGTLNIKIISHKCLLSILMSQNHFIFLHILNLCIFRYAFLIIVVILFNCLNKIWCTSGRKGGRILRCYSFSQSIFLKKGWYFTYSIPLKPSLLSGFLWMSLFTKSMLSLDQP